MAVGRRSPFGKEEVSHGGHGGFGGLTKGYVCLSAHGLVQIRAAASGKRFSETSVPSVSSVRHFPSQTMNALPASVGVFPPRLAGLITQEPPLIERDILLRPEQDRFLFPFLRGTEIPGFSVPGRQDV
jgi:hypothetical protein